LDWAYLYELQQKLDEKIIESTTKNTDDMLEDKILALIVEVSELANETRCFKYWSKKGPNAQEQILEEYVDGIHFLLSLGLDFNYRYDLKKDKLNTVPSLTKGFHDVYEHIYLFKHDPTEENYFKLMNTYLSLSIALNFTELDIFNAYLDKNKVNHMRQHSGY